MVVSDIRESIENSLVQNADGLLIIQKKVELKRGQRHEVIACDIFQDAIISTDSPYCNIEFFVTPYPVIYSNMDLSPVLPNRGPVAASESVLFKANMAVPLSFDTYGEIRQYPSLKSEQDQHFHSTHHLFISPCSFMAIRVHCTKTLLFHSF